VVSRFDHERERVKQALKDAEESIFHLFVLDRYFAHINRDFPRGLLDGHRSALEEALPKLRDIHGILDAIIKDIEDEKRAAQENRSSIWRSRRLTTAGDESPKPKYTLAEDKSLKTVSNVKHSDGNSAAASSGEDRPVYVRDHWRRMPEPAPIDPVSASIPVDPISDDDRVERLIRAFDVEVVAAKAAGRLAELLWRLRKRIEELEAEGLASHAEAAE